MKKFSIVKAIDESILRKNMYEYQDNMRATTGDECYYPYIFMNKETLDALADVTTIAVCEKLNNSNSIIGYYCDNKVFADNTLKFGEIELR